MEAVVLVSSVGGRACPPGSDAGDSAQVLQAHNIRGKLCGAGTERGASSSIPADRLYNIVQCAGTQELESLPANALRNMWDWRRRRKCCKIEMGQEGHGKLA